jgi:hypothetical protein
MASGGLRKPILLFRNAFIAPRCREICFGALQQGTLCAASRERISKRGDYHVHLSGALTIEKAVALAHTRGVKFGIVEHPEPGYKIVNDAALRQYLDLLKNYPVYRGLQPVYPDWAKALSKELLGQLDYILMDALTLPEKNGGWLRIWRSDTTVADKQAFMARYVDFNLHGLRNPGTNL